jgi:hypothetical protein
VGFGGGEWEEAGVAVFVLGFLRGEWASGS